ncbi:MAG: hypothetical protein ACI8VW_003338 [bacterium]|jgi:hypothetical protein
MFIRKKPAAWLLKSIMCSALVLSLAACSSSDDDVITPPTDGSGTTDVDGGDDGDDGDDDAVQETANTDGTSTFIVPLSAEQQVPAIDLELATGEGNLSIDRATGAISGSVTVSALSGQAQMAHIHSGLGGTNGGVLLGLTGNDIGTVWTVPADSVLDAGGLIALANGGLYLNVHTDANPLGEIRGQIIPIGILFEDSELSGGEEVPPVVTDASGVGVSTVNSASGAISATIFVTGLDIATMAHIHSGAEGENGAVIITMERDAENPGIWRTPAASTLTEEQITAYQAEALYFNVHSDANTGGEIRGQL